jgi:hypothetical protein
VASKKKLAQSNEVVGKRLQFDRETWNAVDVLARDQMKDIQELTEEAFRDLLKKYGRTNDTREAFRLSAREKPPAPKRQKR